MIQYVLLRNVPKANVPNDAQCVCVCSVYGTIRYVSNDGMHCKTHPERMRMTVAFDPHDFPSAPQSEREFPLQFIVQLYIKCIVQFNGGPKSRWKSPALRTPAVAILAHPTVCVVTLPATHRVGR